MALGFKKSILPKSEDVALMGGMGLSLLTGGIAPAILAAMYKQSKTSQEEELAAQQKDAMAREDVAEVGRRAQTGNENYTGPRTLEGQLFGRQDMTADDLMGRIDPEFNLKRAQQVFHPAPPQEYTLKPGESRMRGTEVVASLPPDVPSAGPRGWYQHRNGGRPFLAFDNDKQTQKALAEGLWALAPDPNAGGRAPGIFRPATAADIERLRLDPTGAYQIEEDTGRAHVITQPKQSVPTESAQGAAYNAGRIADALTAASGIISRNPGAATSFALEATDGIPGLAAAGRMMSGEDEQMFRNNMADAVDAIITLGTGAAYTGEQKIAARNAYLPQIGEKQKTKDEKYRKLISTYGLAKEKARAAGINLPNPEVFAPMFGLNGAGQQPSPGGIPTPKTQAEFDSLPSGTVYVDPDDGRQYRKP